MIAIEISVDNADEMEAVAAWLDLGQDGAAVFAELAGFDFHFSIDQAEALVADESFAPLDDELDANDDEQMPCLLCGE